MTDRLMSLLRCPVSQGILALEIIASREVTADGRAHKIVDQGVLRSVSGWIFPIIDGIPRMLPDAFLEYEAFLRQHMKDYERSRQLLLTEYAELLSLAFQKNARTRKSFEYEWDQFDYGADRTWNEDKPGMIGRFLKETGQSRESITNKLIFDAGCGNGLLDIYLAEMGSEVVALDFTKSIEEAAKKSHEVNAMFVQGDVRYPPFATATFDLIHCSGVLVHVATPRTAFANLTRFLRPLGLMSVWVYHPQMDRIHNLMLVARKYTGKLPFVLQKIIIRTALLPFSFIVKRIKGNRQTWGEMRTDLLDHFTPEFRWEFQHEEVLEWFRSAGMAHPAITTSEKFGFNTIGISGVPSLVDPVGI